MTEVPLPALEAGVVDHGQRWDPKAAFKSVAVSLLVNGVCPFGLYKVLSGGTLPAFVWRVAPEAALLLQGIGSLLPHYPNGSIMPLLWASAFPVLGLLVGLVRTRAIDFIAVIALFSITYSVIATILAGEIRLAMILGATQGFVIAAIFGITALMGKPVLFFISRQFVAGNDPEARRRFAVVNEADRGRTFFIASMVWIVGILTMAVASIVLALLLEPATYLLLNNIINMVVNIALVVWSIRFTRPRLTKVAEEMFGAEAVAQSGM